MVKIKWLIAILIGLIWQIAIGFVSSLFVNTDSIQYLELTKPIFYPQPIVFSIAWGIIYVLVGFLIGALIVKERNKKLPFILIAVINVLNMLWIFVFFVKYRISIALLIIFIDLIVNIILYIYLYRIKFKYRYFLIPVILWYIFALALNYSIVMIN